MFLCIRGTSNLHPRNQYRNRDFRMSFSLLRSTLTYSSSNSVTCFDDCFFMHFRATGALWSSSEQKPFPRNNFQIVVPVMNKIFYKS